MSVNRLTLDTNILIYAVDRDSKHKHERAVSLIDQAIHLDCVLSLQSLCEFYSAATRKKYATHDEATSFIKELMVIFPIIVSSYKTLPLALKAVDRYNLSFWDGLLWATAKENGCSLIITEDFQDNLLLEGVKLKNPFSSENRLESYFSELPNG